MRTAAHRVTGTGTEVTAHTHDSVRNPTLDFPGAPPCPKDSTQTPQVHAWRCLGSELLSQVPHAPQPPISLSSHSSEALLRLLQPLPGARDVLGWLGTSTAHPATFWPPALLISPLCDVSCIFLGVFLSFFHPLYSHPPQITILMFWLLNIFIISRPFWTKMALLISEQTLNASTDMDKGLHTLTFWLLEAEAANDSAPK